MAAALNSDFADQLTTVEYGKPIDAVIEIGIELGRQGNVPGLNWLADELEGVVKELRRAAAGIHQVNGERPRLAK